MALTKQQKDVTLDRLKVLLSEAKIMVFAHYDGLTVKEAQQLRQNASENGCSIRVAKNRLVKIAIKDVDGYKDADTTGLTGQLMYAFSSEDEVAPAQVLANFAKEHPALKLCGAIDQGGKLFEEVEVKQLAALPSKAQLQAQVVATIAAPLSGFVNVMAGNLRGIVNVLNARIADQEG